MCIHGERINKGSLKFRMVVVYVLLKSLSNDTDAWIKNHRPSAKYSTVVVSPFLDNILKTYSAFFCFLVLCFLSLLVQQTQTLGNMKNSPFVNIPTIPTTFSGQWLTFSHMANHYRKLINVKPRVDTNPPRNSFTNVQIPSKQSSIKQLKTTAKSSKFNQNQNPAQTETKTKKKWTRPKMASKMLDYEYHALSKGLMNSPNGSFKGSSSDGYQVVFGPSSIKSSVDAIVSDPEINNVEPQLSSISIGEKIRKFLDHIHAQDQNHSLHKIGGRPLTTNRERREPNNGKKSREELQMSENHHSNHNRHSNCFTPFEVPSKGTKKRLVNKSISSRQRSQHLDPSTTLLSSDSKRIMAKAQRDREHESPRMLQKTNHQPIQKTSPACTRSLHHHHHHHHSQHQNNQHQTLQDLISSLKATRAKKIGTKRKSADSPNISPRSVSVGTIRGSDELTEEFLMPSSPGPRNQSTIQIDTEDLPTSWLKDKVERGVVRINNAYFHLAGGTRVSHPKIHHHHDQQQQHPNKDSSRDSAYGFSSGESRITTRESTPEKKSNAAVVPVKGSQDHVNGSGKYKSSLSTVASSVNQDNCSSHVNSSGHSSSSEKSILRHSPPSPSLTTTNRKELLLEDKYINFLAMVTDDIVGRGIYTNKGIKSAFKSHLLKHSDLEMDKMLCLLERLRIDMGVPKDDSLNQLEFGYGSIEYSTGPYFYRNQPSLPSPSTTEIEGEALTTSGGNSRDDEDDEELPNHL